MAVKGLAKPKNGDVLPACVAVKRLEEEGDSLYHEWLGKLFEGSPDPVCSSSGRRCTTTWSGPSTAPRTPPTCWSPSPSSTAEPWTPVGYILAIIAVALVFDFINGFHDSANSIATVVATRVLSPGVAVIWAATFNFVAAFLVGTAVAKTIGKGLVEPGGGGRERDPGRADRRHRVEPHHLVGRTSQLLLSRAHGRAGRGGRRQGGRRRADHERLGQADAVHCPLAADRDGARPRAHRGALLAAPRAQPGPLDRLFRRLQLLSAALYSMGHGANDAQKTMGIIVGLLVATQHLFVGHAGWMSLLHLPNADRVPLWVEIRSLLRDFSRDRTRRLEDREDDGHADHPIAALRRVLRRDCGRHHAARGIEPAASR